MDSTKTRNGKTNLFALSATRMWWLTTSAIAVALILGLATLEVLRLLARPLAVLIFGLTLAAALAPIVSWLERRMPRLVAILLVYIMLVTLLVGVIWAIAPPLINQVQDFSSRIPDLTTRAQELFDRWGQPLGGGSIINSLASEIGSLGVTLLRLPLTISSGIFIFLLIIFISFYMLVEAEDIQQFILSLAPTERRQRIDNVLGSMSQSMGGYFRGSVLNGLIVGILTFFGLLVLGIDFALVFAVLNGLLELIPVAGPIIGGVIIVGLTLLQSPGKALAALIFVIVLQQIENNLLVPNIMRSQTKISPLLAILAVFAGGSVGGFLGALVAIPIAAALRVFVRQVIAPAIRRQTLADTPEGESQ